LVVVWANAGMAEIASAKAAELTIRIIVSTSGLWGYRKPSDATSIDLRTSLQPACSGRG
jgi:hypothetical protein